MSMSTSLNVSSYIPKSSINLSSGKAADKSYSKYCEDISRNQRTKSSGMSGAKRRCHSSCESAGRCDRKQSTSSRRSGLGSYGIRSLSAILRKNLCRWLGSFMILWCGEDMKRDRAQEGTTKPAPSTIMLSAHPSHLQYDSPRQSPAVGCQGIPRSE